LNLQYNFNSLLTFVTEISSSKDIRIVSQYVAHQMARRCTSSFIVSVTEIFAGRGNQALEEWIFQLDILFRLARDYVYIELAVTGPKALPPFAQKWSIKGFVEYRDLSELRAEMVQKNMWLVPILVSHPCFDAFHICNFDPSNKKIQVRFIQLTTAKTQTMLLKYVVSTGKRLEELGFTITKLSIAFLLPEDKYDTFITPEWGSNQLDEWFTKPTKKWDPEDLLTLTVQRITQLKRHGL
jgi:hypothetical protein